MIALYKAELAVPKMHLHTKNEVSRPEVKSRNKEQDSQRQTDRQTDTQTNTFEHIISGICGLHK